MKTERDMRLIIKILAKDQLSILSARNLTTKFSCGCIHAYVSMRWRKKETKEHLQKLAKIDKRSIMLLCFHVPHAEAEAVVDKLTGEVWNRHIAPLSCSTFLIVHPLWPMIRPCRWSPMGRASSPISSCSSNTILIASFLCHVKLTSHFPFPPCLFAYFGACIRFCIFDTVCLCVCVCACVGVHEIDSDAAKPHNHLLSLLCLHNINVAPKYWQGHIKRGMGNKGEME